MNQGLSILLIAALFPMSKGEAQTRPMGQIRVFVIYEPVYTVADVDILSRVRPDFVCRGWFKWASSMRWKDLAPVYREWGFAWDRRAQGTFRFDTVSAIFADARRYAQGK